MLRTGHNEIDGVSVEVVRKRVRRINIRIGPDGGVRLSVPRGRATLREGEAFLKEKWAWVVKARADVLARPPAVRAPVAADELAALESLLRELNATWSARLGEPGVAWKVRRVKSVWGCCHWRSRRVTYNAELAHAPRELVEYVVVHEFTHFAIHGHGPKFHALMDRRLPSWKILRRRLNGRDWGEFAPPAPPPAKPVQGWLPGFGGPSFSKANGRGVVRSPPLDAAANVLKYAYFNSPRRSE